MTRKESEKVLKVLGRIKEPDSYVQEAILIIKKNLAMFDNQRGKLKDTYETDVFSF